MGSSAHPARCRRARLCHGVPPPPQDATILARAALVSGSETIFSELTVRLPGARPRALGTPAAAGRAGHASRSSAWSVKRTTCSAPAGFPGTWQRSSQDWFQRPQRESLCEPSRIMTKPLGCLMHRAEASLMKLGMLKCLKILVSSYS